MNIPHEALELENRFLGHNQEATLAAAYHILRKHWDAGGCERETGLHLMFLSWYGIVAEGSNGDRACSQMGIPKWGFPNGEIPKWGHSTSQMGTQHV